MQARNSSSLLQPSRCQAAVHLQSRGLLARACHKSTVVLTVFFREEGVVAEAAPGDELMDVAKAAGVTLPAGCWQGNCGVCEVEVFKYTGDAQADASVTPAVVRACITKLPPGYSRIEVAQMDDAIWGLDGFNT